MKEIRRLAAGLWAVLSTVDTALGWWNRLPGLLRTVSALAGGLLLPAISGWAAQMNGLVEANWRGLAFVAVPIVGAEVLIGFALYFRMANTRRRRVQPSREGVGQSQQLQEIDYWRCPDGRLHQWRYWRGPDGKGMYLCENCPMQVDKVTLKAHTDQGPTTVTIAKTAVQTGTRMPEHARVGCLVTASEGTEERRQRELLVRLRQEYILSHDGLSPQLLASMAPYAKAMGRNATPTARGGLAPKRVRWPIIEQIGGRNGYEDDQVPGG